ncbi:MAG: hypothetical protein ACXW5U_05925 [Thermoanaerobaculia bacterium]
MSVSSLALPLLLLFASTDEPGPTPARVSAAAKSPETLWALILDPATRDDDRMRAAEMAKDVLPPAYIPKLAAVQLALADAAARQPELERALDRVRIQTADAPGIDIVRDLPCGTQFEERVVLQTLRMFPMTAETYGVVRNVVDPRPGEFLPRTLPEWWTYAGDDEWHAAQAFIVELSRPHETDGRMVISEPIATVSRMMYDLERMIGSMRSPFPHTAFLALANRIDNEPQHDGNECLLIHDAARLVRIVDDAPLPREPSFGDMQTCRAGLARFHDWLEKHRGELEAGASAEIVAFEEARVRMNGISLCRQ